MLTHNKNATMLLGMMGPIFRDCEAYSILQKSRPVSLLKKPPYSLTHYINFSSFNLEIPIFSSLILLTYFRFENRALKK